MNIQFSFLQIIQLYHLFQFIDNKQTRDNYKKFITYKEIKDNLHMSDKNILIVTRFPLVFWFNSIDRTVKINSIQFIV